jgi:hypothetical protein
MYRLNVNIALCNECSYCVLTIYLLVTNENMADLSQAQKALYAVLMYI